MNYYQLKSESDPKIIGVKNGVHQGEIKWEKFNNQKTHGIIEEYFSLGKYRKNVDSIEPYDFQIDYVEAYKSAKMTDFFSFTPRLWGIDFFLSTNVKLLLETFNLPTKAFIPAFIYHKGIQYQYWALYIPVSYREDSVNFKKSIFFEKIGLLQSKQILFDNVNEYLNNRFVHAQKITLNNLFDKKLDLFTTLFNGYGYYLSEGLKKAIEKNNFTGIKIKEPLNPEILID